MNRFQDPKLLNDLISRGSNSNSSSVEARSITIVMGVDLVNVIHLHFVACDVETAQMWLSNFNPISHNSRMSHICPATALMKQYAFTHLLYLYSFFFK